MVLLLFVLFFLVFFLFFLDRNGYVSRYLYGLFPHGCLYLYFSVVDGMCMLGIVLSSLIWEEETNYKISSDLRENQTCFSVDSKSVQSEKYDETESVVIASNQKINNPSNPSKEIQSNPSNQRDSYTYRQKIEQEISWKVHENSMITLSARTALDVWLKINHFERGSEIIIAAVNIPDMVKVLREHGIVPVPVDIAFDTLFPKACDVEIAITKKTVAVLVAQLFGRRNDIAEIAMVCEKYQLPLIEDLAESWSGTYTPAGAMADLSLFSFGPIKFNTAFGGGIAVVKDKKLCEAMRAAYANFPIRSNAEMISKFFKYLVVAILINVPLITGFLMKLARFFRIDAKNIIVSMLRGFPSNFFEKLRHQPDTLLMKFLRYRILSYDHSDRIKNSQNGELLVRTILETEKELSKRDGISPLAIVPGQAAQFRNHWLFPLIVENPAATMKELNDAGIDAYRGATQLNVIDPPEEIPQLKAPVVAKTIMDHTIYLPIHKEVSPVLVREMGQLVAAIVRKTNSSPVFAHVDYISIN